MSRRPRRGARARAAGRLSVRPWAARPSAPPCVPGRDAGALRSAPPGARSPRPVPANARSAGRSVSPGARAAGAEGEERRAWRGGGAARGTRAAAASRGAPGGPRGRHGECSTAWPSRSGKGRTQVPGRRCRLHFPGSRRGPPGESERLQPGAGSLPSSRRWGCAQPGGLRWVGVGGAWAAPHSGRHRADNGRVGAWVGAAGLLLRAGLRWPGTARGWEGTGPPVAADTARCGFVLAFMPCPPS